MKTLDDIKTAAAEIKTRIETMLADKEKDLAALADEKKAREITLAEIRGKMAQTDSPAEYAELKKDETRLAAEIEFYIKRTEERQNREFVTEEESDSVIDSLLAMEHDGERIFAACVLDNLDGLKREYDRYGETWRDIEQILSSWTTRIHPNYRSSGSTFYVDGKRTSRSPKPVPVRSVPYKGGEIYDTAEGFIKAAEKLRAKEV